MLSRNDCSIVVSAVQLAFCCCCGDVILKPPKLKLCPQQPDFRVRRRQIRSFPSLITKPPLVNKIYFRVYSCALASGIWNLNLKIKLERISFQPQTNKLMVQHDSTPLNAGISYSSRATRTANGDRSLWDALLSVFCSAASKSNRMCYTLD